MDTYSFYEEGVNQIIVSDVSLLEKKEMLNAFLQLYGCDARMKKNARLAFEVFMIFANALLKHPELDIDL